MRGCRGHLTTGRTGSDVFEGTEWIKFATIPIVAALIGYGTNWVAVKMTFWPLEFKGIKPPWLGWQGIIPSKARKMASISVDSTMSKLGNLAEIVQQMDPEQIAEHVLEHARPLVPQQVDQMAQRDNPVLWNALPQPVKDAVIARVQSRLATAAHGLMQDVSQNIDQLMDMRLMVIELMAADKRLTTRMFEESGGPEFRFIINSGLWFGAILGLFQMGIQIVFDAWWVLPVAGIAVGYITNWLALTLIFSPLEPRQYGPFTVQGRFLKRQAEVATVFARLVTRDILTLRNFADHMLNGPRGDRTRALVDKHLSPIVDEALGIARPAVRLAVGSQGMESMKAELSAKAIEMSLDPFDDPVFSAERSVIVEKTMRDRMIAMTPVEFQELLRPAFQEDELTLILVGAFLGGLAGLAQSLFVFGV